MAYPNLSADNDPDASFIIESPSLLIFISGSPTIDAHLHSFFSSGS